MMSRQLTWYNSLISEEETVTTRDVEPFVVCSDKVQFIDPPCRLDLLPIGEGSFLPPRKNKTNKVFTRQTLTRMLKTFKTLHRRTVSKPS